jgi:PAS domain S-box-containing protein
MPEPHQDHSILDGIAAGLIVLGTDRTIAHWNAWMASASRRSLATAVGKTLAQVFPDTTMGVLNSAIDSAFDAGASTLLTNALHSELLPLQTRARRPLLHDVIVSPVGDTQPRKCVIQVIDVTDSTRRERFLRDRQKARYDALVKSAPDVILNVDSDGIIRLANPAAVRQFGYSADELIGRETALLFETKSAWSDIWESVSAGTASTRPAEVQVRRKDGTLRYFEVSAARWQDGTRTFVTAILRDVTDRRDAELALRERDSQSRASAKALAELNEALEEKSKTLSEMDRRKDEFLATLAHELRNPLAPLRNGLQLLKLAKDDAGLVERTRHMMDLQLGQMVRLIDDLLDVGRITNDRIALTREKTSLDKIIRQAVETSGPLIHAQQHELTIDLPQREIGLDADVVRLTQVFANLLNNAAKYTPRSGSISITAEDHGDSVTVRVSDNGIGIPRELLPQVFEMFMQADKSLERAQGGLGIGLSLVKRLVEMHDGTVEAHSKGTGHGSVFVVRLPTANAAAVQEPPPVAEVHAAPSTGHRILVVDDNEDAATSLALLLRLMGHETRTANNGLDAIELADQFQPDVALLDIGMPKLNGYETARRMRQKTWGREMLLVALTGWGQEADRRRSSDAGFDSHLVKPVDVAEIERLLAASHSRLAAPAASTPNVR